VAVEPPLTAPPVNVDGYRIHRRGATSDPPLVVLLCGMATTKQYGGNLDAARARLVYMLTVPSLALPLLVDGRPMDAWARLRGLDDIVDALVEVGANT
jgi:hypothetical protein